MKKLLGIFCIVAFFAACTKDKEAALDLRLSVDVLMFQDIESKQKIYVSSNTSWVSSSDKNWCVASVIQQLGNDSVEIRVQANTTFDERTAYIKFENAEKTIIRTIKVVQKKIGTNALRAADSLLLVSIYNAMDGDNWTNNSGWKTSSLENWHGVTIKDDRVAGIAMENNNLSGEIPEELNKLTMLDSISFVSELGIVGDFPLHITQIEGLKYLNISGTAILGDIPAEIANLQNLETLILSSNAGITGSIPKELGNIISLKVLVLHNMFAVQSTIPLEIAQLVNLDTLSLTSCNLKGFIPEALFMDNLKYLSLNNNKFIGYLPTEVDNLKNIEYLNLAGNSFTGEIPSELGKLDTLLKLFIENNHLEGIVPSNIFDIDEVTICPQKGTTFSNHSCL